MDPTLFPQHPVVDWGNFLETFIEHAPFPVSLKAVDTGRYIKANSQAAHFAGLTLDRFIGMNIQDIANQIHLEPHFINQVLEMDQNVIQHHEVYSFQQIFVDYAKEVQIQRVVKLPTIAPHMDNSITGILSYSLDIKPQIDLNQLFEIYQRYFPPATAIIHFLQYLKVSQFFYEAPSQQEMDVLLSMRKCSHSKYIAEALHIPYRTVDIYKASLREKTHTLDLEEIVSLIRVRNDRYYTDLY
jgi:hypothetical protein